MQPFNRTAPLPIKIRDLLQQLSFSDICEEFIQQYRDEDVEQRLSEYQSIYEEMREKLDIYEGLVRFKDPKVRLQSIDGVIDLFIQSDNRRISIGGISWFLTPRLEIAQEVLDNYSKKEIMSHYLFIVGTKELYD